MTEVHFTVLAIAALQEAAEAYLVRLFGIQRHATSMANESPLC